MALKTYYVYDPGVGETIGGERVKTDAKGRKIVALNDGQADYLIQAGAVGKTPLAEVGGEQRAHLHQVMGGRIPATPDGAPGKPTRTARQDPNTMASKLAEGFHPVLGTTQTTEADRTRPMGKPRISKSIEG